MSWMQVVTAECTLPPQLLLLLINAVVWAYLTRALGRAAKRHVVKAEWGRRWLALSTRSMQAFHVILLDEQAYLDVACEFVGVMVQHMVGGLLCAPSAFRLLEQPYAGILARHGLLCEAGWELQDALVRASQLAFGGESGRARNPTGLLVMLTVHHAMGLGLAVPANLYLGESPDLHELAMLLQAAAASAVLMQNYGYTLDVGTPGGLRRMKVSVVAVWLIVLYSRVLRFAYLVARLLATAVVQEMHGLAAVGALVALLMCYVNLLFLLDSTSKVRKFVGMVPHTSEPRLSEAARESFSAMVPTPNPPGLQRWASGGADAKRD